MSETLYAVRRYSVDVTLEFDINKIDKSELPDEDLQRILFLNEFEMVETSYGFTYKIHSYSRIFITAMLTELIPYYSAPLDITSYLGMIEEE